MVTLLSSLRGATIPTCPAGASNPARHTGGPTATFSWRIGRSPEAARFFGTSDPKGEVFIPPWIRMSLRETDRLWIFVKDRGRGEWVEREVPQA